MTQKIDQNTFHLILLILYFGMTKTNLYQELIKIHNVTSVKKSHIQFYKEQKSFKNFCR